MATKASAFALLGPYADWMTQEIGYRYAHQAGGPMALGEEYRWNLPVITYGFDSSFLAYFGNEGVAEVENAIRTLNFLPKASDLSPGVFFPDHTFFPVYVYNSNALAVRGNFHDLKSHALSLLVEQLGLAPPSSSAYTLRARTITLDASGPLPYYVTNYQVIQRNYDFFARNASAYVNLMSLVYDIYELT